MHRNFAKAAIATALLTIPFAAGASQLSDWVDTVNTRIDRSVPDTNVSGEIRVRFYRGEDGRAAGVRVVSGDPELVSCAKRTLKRLGVLPPLPAGYNAKTPIIMGLLIGGGNQHELANYHSWTRAVRQAHAQASAQNAQLAERHEGLDQLALASPR